MPEQELWALLLFTESSTSGINLGTPVFWPLILHVSSSPRCCHSTGPLVLRGVWCYFRPLSNVQSPPPISTLHAIPSVDTTQLLFWPLLLYSCKPLRSEHPSRLLCPQESVSSIQAQLQVLLSPTWHERRSLMSTEYSTCPDHSSFCIPRQVLVQDWCPLARQ